jgi:hypothetical protein
MQANPVAFGRMLDRLAPWVWAGADVVELYAGVGTIGMSLAAAGRAASVRCVEVPTPAHALLRPLAKRPEWNRSSLRPSLRGVVGSAGVLATPRWVFRGTARLCFWPPPGRNAAPLTLSLSVSDCDSWWGAGGPTDQRGGARAVRGGAEEAGAGGGGQGAVGSLLLTQYSHLPLPRSLPLSPTHAQVSMHVGAAGDDPRRWLAGADVLLVDPPRKVLARPSTPAARITDVLEGCARCAMLEGVHVRCTTHDE